MNTEEVLYTKDNMRGMFKGSRNSIIKFLRNVKPERWAIYRANLNGFNFHNSSDEGFLIDHNDTFWINKGVSRGQLSMNLDTWN